MSRKTSNNKGFTLAEVLIVVSILSVLLAVATGLWISVQKDVRQKALDSKAEIIYTAVQNRLTQMYAGGLSASYDPANYTSDNSMKCLNCFPGDYDPDAGEQLNSNSVYYITSESGEAFNNIVNETVLSDGLDAGHIVIELIPYSFEESNSYGQTATLTAAMVYAVYYSEDVVNVATDYVAKGGPSINEYYKKYRNSEYRKDEGARVGYYGGSSVSGSGATTSLTPTVTFNNGEKLTAVVKVKKSTSILENLRFTFELSDTLGNTYTICYDETNNAYTVGDINGVISQDNNIKLAILGQSYTFAIVLDDLTNPNTRFYSLYGNGSSHAAKLEAGTDITLKVDVTCPEDKSVDSGSASASCNSLFGNGSTESTATISKGRHLQNLDSNSGLVNTITKAVQISNVEFGTDSEWMEYYGGVYYNGLTKITKLTESGSTEETVPNFKPINSSFLSSYTGKDDKGQYTISNLSSAGNLVALFEKLGVNTFSISSVAMTGTRISAKDAAAALVATVLEGQTLNISGCQVYLSKENKDIPSSITAEDNVESYRFIAAPIAGGLVAKNAGTVSITESSASVIIGDKLGSGTSESAGGLIGQNSGSVTIKHSYADNYLYGNSVGGFIGTSTGPVSIDTSYSAGFIGLEKTTSVGAGFVVGLVDTVKDSYSYVAPYKEASDGGIDKNGRISSSYTGTYYSSAKSVTTCTNSYHINGSVGGSNYTVGVDPMALSEKLSSTGFKVDTKGTQPYTLMGQSLTTYIYPRLVGLVHYGDWATEFQAGSLVYYESYKDQYGNIYYGFDGADVDMTLKTDYTIVGDGYGVVFEAYSLTDAVATVKLGEETITINRATDAYYTVVDEKGTEYVIYPLSKELCNPTETVTGFYERVTITQSIGGSDFNKYYDFNPHFARTVKEVTSENAETSEIPATIAIRSPRHLYNLSLYYNGYRAIAYSCNYEQQRDLVYSDYDWTGYSLVSSVKAQKPIGDTNANSFRNTYNGQGYCISDISFVSKDGNYVGMFGYVGNTGRVQNVVLATNFNKNDTSKNYLVQRTDPAGVNEIVYYGILAGKNDGYISNCAVAGYYLTGKDGLIHGYANSKIYLGGLVGENTGTIVNSEADTPYIGISTYRTTCYAGGFVGINRGIINNCYDLGVLGLTAQGGTAYAAGFAGYNSGSIKESYCATSIIASGDGTKVFCFCPTDGAVSSCYYLHLGNYQFVDGLYDYNGDSTTSYGSPLLYEEMVSKTKAKKSMYHNNTTAQDSTATVYPFRAVVVDRNNESIHYGEWLLEPDLGLVGAFYWEHEENGSNDGYKITYIGIDEYENVSSGTTLCTSHDDGGVITEYGYGYFYSNATKKGEEPNIKTQNLELGSSNNVTASTELHKQLPNYTFVAYTTKVATSGDFIYLTGDNLNGQIEIHNKVKVNNKYTFTISPFFANALSYAGAGEISITDGAGHVSKYNSTPGTKDNNYEIRSSAQLQYINWNSNTKDVTTWLDFEDYANNGSKIPEKWKHFNYLGFCNGQANDYGTRNDLYFSQSHDVDAQMTPNGSKLFTPIGSMCELNKTDSAAISAAYFNGTYDGRSYTIKNIEIKSESQCVGLFGITISAHLKNLILYSDRGNYIRTSDAAIRTNDASNKGNRNWYCMGGIVGISTMGNAQTGGSGEFTNCTVSAYHIEDIRRNCGYGGTNIGGFVGLTNVSINNCSAVTDIFIGKNNQNENSTRFIRVGGIAGNFRGVELKNCYSGGSISTNNDRKNNQVSCGGIVGGYFTRSNGNVGTIFGTLTTSPKIMNCYSYIDLSGATGASVNARCPIAANANDEDVNGNTSKRVVVSNCYYYRPTAYSILNQKVDQSPKAIEVSYSELSGSVNLTSGTYSGKSILYALNAGSNTGAFGKVTTVDASGGAVDGKYSFPGNATYLNGKNYPFPTLVSQIDLSVNETVNVHYGRWPVSGAYFAEGIDTLDIFTSIDGDGYAYGEYVFNRNNDSKVPKTLTKDDFTVSIPEIAEIVSVESNPSLADSYLVKVKALKDGTVTITEKHSGVDFVLEVKADLEIKTLNGYNTFRLATTESVNVELMLVSAADSSYNFASAAEWNVVSSSIDGEAAAGVRGTLKKNIYDITSYGYEANISVSASYAYNGISYTYKSVLVVYTAGTLGVSNGTNFYETITNARSNTSKAGAATQYITANKTPTCSEEYSFFLYDTEAAGILDKLDSAQGAKITIVARSVSKAGVDMVTTIDTTKLTSLNGYRTVPVVITYSTNGHRDFTDVRATITITLSDNSSYSYELTGLTAKYFE